MQAYLLAVSLDLGDLSLVALGLLLLLNRRNNSPGCSAGADDIYGKKKERPKHVNQTARLAHGG